MHGESQHSTDGRVKASQPATPGSNPAEKRREILSVGEECWLVK